MSTHMPFFVAYSLQSILVWCCFAGLLTTTLFCFASAMTPGYPLPRICA